MNACSFIINGQTKEWYQSYYQTLCKKAGVSIILNVKAFLEKKVLGGRETIKAQYFSEHFCGRTSKKSFEGEFFSACSLFLPHTTLHVSPVYLTLKASGSLQLCLCVNPYRWILNNHLGIQPIYVPMCSRWPHALIKSNLIQMLQPLAAPTRHQPIKQAPSTLPLWFKIGQSFTLPINYELSAEKGKNKEELFP